MKKLKTNNVPHCIQCEGDEMLAVRKDAGLCHDIMCILADTYYTDNRAKKPQVTVVHFVEQLILAEKDLRRLQIGMKTDATRKLKELDALVTSLRFIADACSRNVVGMTVSTEEITVGMKRLLQTAVDRIELVASSYRGLLDGRQAHNEVDYIAPLLTENRE